MALEHDDKEFERSIRQKMEAHEEDVPDFAWSNIQTELNRRRRPTWLPYAIAAMVLFGSMGTWVAMNPEFIGSDSSGLAYESKDVTETVDETPSAEEGALATSPETDQLKSDQQQSESNDADNETDTDEVREKVATAKSSSKRIKPAIADITTSRRNQEDRLRREGTKESSVAKAPMGEVAAVASGTVAKTQARQPQVEGRSTDMVTIETSGSESSDLAVAETTGGIGAVAKANQMAAAIALNEEMPKDSVIKVEEPVTDELIALATDEQEEIVKAPFKHIIEGFASSQYATKEAIADTDEQRVVTHQGSQLELRRIGFAVGARMVLSREKHEWYGGLSVRRLTDRLKMRMADHGDIEYYETKATADNRSVEVRPKYRVYNATETRNFLYLGAETGYSYLAGDDNRIRFTTGLGFEYLAGQSVSYDGVPNPEAQKRFDALNQGRDFNINLQVKVGYLVPLSARYQMGIEPMVTYYLFSVGTADYMVELNPITVGINFAFRYNTLR